MVKVLVVKVPNALAIGLNFMLDCPSTSINLIIYNSTISAAIEYLDAHDMLTIEFNINPLDIMRFGMRLQIDSIIEMFMISIFKADQDFLH